MNIDIVNIWYINTTMEMMSIVYLSIILCACVSNKRKTDATHYLIYLTILEIITLLGQIVQRVCVRSIYYGNQNSAVFYLAYIFFCVDFVLMHSETIVYYIYIIKYLQHIDGYCRTEKKQRRERSELLYLMVVGILSSAFFISSIWTKQIFYITPDGFDHYTVKYYVLFGIWITSQIICGYKIYSERKILGLRITVLMSLYLVVRYVLIPLDIRYKMAFSYNLQAIMVLIFFLNLDRKQGEELLETENRINQQELELKYKKGQLMLSQISPHFLYNTLSVIDYLCGKDVKTARTAISRFSEYLRTNVENIAEEKLVPFRTELEHTKNYLWIEELRFSDILEVEYEIEESDFWIPPLTLQPLCENAVKHGIRGKEEGGKLKIRTQRLDDSIRIIVEDDGIGFDPEKADNDGKLHIGIANVRGRLEMLCGGTLEIKSVPNIGTIAIITLQAKMK